MIKWIIFLFICISGYRSLAQTCCSAGAPLSNSITVNNTNQLLSFTLGYEYKGINLLVDNNSRLVNDPRTRYGQNISFKTDYVLNDNWAFSANLPFVFQSRANASESQSSFGVGDLSVITQYKLFQKNDIRFFLAGGVELPTGQTNHTSVSSIFLSPDMQSGSGTYDLLAGGSVFYDKLFHPSFSSSIEFLYKRNGTNDNFTGRRFGFGHETLATLSMRYQLVHSAGFITPDLAFKYRSTSANREQLGDAANSGGYWLSLPLGLSFIPDLDKSIRAFAELPLYQNLSGLQITTSFTFGVQLRYSIQKETTNKNISL